ncbi:hypothetical protein EZV62_014297 [Acer yangbiense]|uniref:Uncharacterized protein n=1 Tax=Acer yangbiense TaxID=1000413 RepID=A0A5C7HS93_9ROSI|nr:hypothetical protein EZV62_014297 [Acer yangbiense]
MRSAGCSSIVRVLEYFILVVTAVVLNGFVAVAVVVPRSNCYAIDNSSRIVDFDSDLVVRFCKDVESRSQTVVHNTMFSNSGNMLITMQGYVDFGRFDKFNHFVAGSGHVDFVQGFYSGDLVNCEHSYDKMGRTAQVNVICGNCLNGQCKGGLGCICNVSYDSTCRVFVELAIPCEKPGPSVFEGFTVGFHPRSWEIVYNGMTQPGFEKSRRDFSFGTEQTQVALYMTAIASVSTLVRKPSFKVLPEKGLEVRLLGSAAARSPPTTLSPTMMTVDWRCETARDTPYEVNVSIPVEGYEPIQFFLTKTCEYRQNKEGDSTRGWAIFGVISCMTRFERLRGIDALPGMTILSACLETVSGAAAGGQGYSRPEDLNSAFTNEASWERPSVPPQGIGKSNERKYGAI